MHDLSEIVLATGNPHKVAELQPIFSAALGDAVRLVSLAQFDGLSEPVEDGGTIEANARIKARGYAEQTGTPCLADDSGLVVDALGGAPGVDSSHYCTDGRETGMDRESRDAANNAKLLRELAGVAAADRTARFLCVMALAVPGVDGIAAEARGAFEGRIGEPPRVPAGDQGFGYDPLFLVGPEHARTGAELAPEEKNRISHRALAGAAMAARLRELIS